MAHSHKNLTSAPEFDLAPLLPTFPSTRFQGSKRKILPALARAFAPLQFHSCLDLYAGTASVSLLLRLLNKKVDANDYLSFNQNSARLFLTADRELFHGLDYTRDLEFLFTPKPGQRALVAEHFAGIFFTGAGNTEIDTFCQNVTACVGLKRDLYIYAMGQALLMKRPYNLFHRANLNMRLRPVERSFGNKKTWETPLKEHCAKIIGELAKFPFPKAQHRASVFSINTLQLDRLPASYDFIYADPPYLNSSAKAVNYVDFYHFLDGLLNYELFANGNGQYAHRPLIQESSAWASPSGALDEFHRMADHWKNAILFVSYRSDGMPTPDAMVEALSQNGRSVECHSCGEYKYALSGASLNEELFLISTP